MITHDTELHAKNIAEINARNDAADCSTESVDEHKCRMIGFYDATSGQPARKDLQGADRRAYYAGYKSGEYSLRLQATAKRMEKHNAS
jgi:hypothetical protein